MYYLAILQRPLIAELAYMSALILIAHLLHDIIG